MLFSRWKLVTGAFGLSIGGIAAFGGQTPQTESVRLVRADEPPPSKAPATEPPAPMNVLPPLPTAPATLPPVDLPALPIPESKPKPQTPPTLPSVPPPSKPDDTPVLPVSGVTRAFELPELPPSPPSVTPPNVTPPSVTPPSAPATIAPTPVASPTTPSVSPPSKPVTITPVETTVEVPPSLPPAAKPAPAALPAPAINTKFRIVLRVGSDNPTFEVRHNDDLVMKVVCDKVDIKSPEKGQGASNVVATGKVRFVGFGAEGTCDSLSFIAGTGEVSLTGNVNVKVRDKIGRVESELNADKMQYKLDQTALTGVLKP